LTLDLVVETVISPSDLHRVEGVRKCGTTVAGAWTRAPTLEFRAQHFHSSPVFPALRPKRQRAGALQDASRISGVFVNAPAFWTAVVLHRFSPERAVAKPSRSTSKHITASKSSKTSSRFTRCDWSFEHSRAPFHSSVRSGIFVDTAPPNLQAPPGAEYATPDGA